MASQTIGVATVGLGVGEQHAVAYARLPECRLLWVFDPDRAKAEEVAARLGGVPIAAGFHTVLDDPAVRLLSIASPDDIHAAQVVEALSAGKHVFVEKPLCRSAVELSAIKSAWVRSNGCRIASNLVLRAAPLYRWLRDAIATGELGDIYAFDGDYLYGRLQKMTGGWRRDVEDYSVMQGGGIHLIDLMLWLTGERPVSVTAVGNRIASAGTAFRYDDFAAATFTFQSGLVGRITANFGCVHRHQHVLRVFGTKATFIYDDAGPRLHASRDPGTSARSLQDLSPLPATKGDLIPAFIEDLLNGSSADAQAQREFDAMSACLAADAALRTSGPVSVDYL